MTLGNLVRVLQIALDLYGNDVEVETLVVPLPYQDALLEIHHLGCGKFGHDEFTNAVSAGPEARRPRQQNGRAVSAPVETAPDDTMTKEEAAELLKAIEALADEQQTSRLPIPFVVKELSQRLRLPQRETKSKLAALMPLTLGTLHLEAASLGLLRRDRQTRLSHYIVVDGFYRCAIRLLRSSWPVN